MEDADFIKFQDDFYNLLEKYGVSKITGEHPRFNDICETRNIVTELIDKNNSWHELYLWYNVKLYGAGMKNIQEKCLNLFLSWYFGTIKYEQSHVTF